MYVRNFRGGAFSRPVYKGCDASFFVGENEDGPCGATYVGPANTKYFQNIFKRTEKNLLETFTINMNKTLAKCSITIGKTLVK